MTNPSAGADDPAEHTLGVGLSDGIDVFQELELKLASDTPIPAAVIADRMRALVTVGPGTVIEQADAYLDTPSRRLAAAGLAARCRRRTTETRIEVKPVPIDAQLIAERTEIATDVKAGTEPGDALRALIEGVFPLTLDAAPVVQVRLETTRHAYEVHSPAFAAELCIDHVVARPPEGTRVAEFYEIELEFRRGDVASFRECAQWMADMFVLRPSEESKYLHALRLLGLPGYTYAPPRPAVTPDMPAGVAARTNLGHLLAIVRAYDAGTRVGMDSEHLHKMRVATRRIRNGLRTYRGLFAPEEHKRLRKGFAWIARHMGGVRDLDVHQLALPTWRAELGGEPAAGWERLAARMRGRWHTARRKLLEALDSERYAALLVAADAAFDPARGAADGPTFAALAEPAVAACGARFDAALARALKTREAEDIHDLRIEGKRLRYTRDLFKHAVPMAATGSNRGHKRFQDALGEIQDADQAAQLVTTLRTEELEQAAPDRDLLEVLDRISDACAAIVALGPKVVEDTLASIGEMDEDETSP